MIKLVVCDGDGTLELPSPSQSTLALLKRMQQLGIGLAVASNSPRPFVESRFKQAGLAQPLILVTSTDIGALKPSPKFIEHISTSTGIQPHEMIFLGDSDTTDIFCAINSHILPFAALYSSKGQPKYGVGVTNPAELALYLETFGMQSAPFFGWSFVSSKDAVEVYALIGDHGTMGLTAPLRSFLKNKQDVEVGTKKNTLGRILFHYFLSQTYLSGLIQTANYVAVYPGHAANTQNLILSQYSVLLQRVLGRRYLPSLLIRHTDTTPSHTVSGANRDIYQQLSTVHLNPEYKKRLKGKRVFVLDDFTTSGNSLETARVMLLQGGAASVVGLAFAKWRTTYNIASINDTWNPYAPFPLSPAQVTITQHTGMLNPPADQYFSDVIWKAANT